MNIFFIPVVRDALNTLAIGSIAYAIVRLIMMFCNVTVGIWFGRKGGLFLWLVTTLLLTYVYGLFN